MKTIIASTHCTRTDLIEIQFKTFKKFIKGDYEFIVFNDAKDHADIINFNNANIRNEIKDICYKLEIKCIDVPQNLHNQRNILFSDTIEPSSNHPSCRTSIATQYLYNWVNNYNFDYLIIIDADMFLIDYFDINEYKDIDIAFVPHSDSNSEISINYMWNGFIIVNNKKIKNFDIPNFDCGRVLGFGVDTAGQTHFWLEKYSSQLNIKYIDCGHIGMRENYEKIKNYYTKELQEYFEKLSDNNYGLINKEILLNNKVLHIRGAGGNWDISNESFNKYYKNKHGDNRKNDLLVIEWGKYQYFLTKIIIEFVDKIINK